MATLVKTHPAAIDIASIQYFGTRPLTWFEVDFGAAVNAKTGPASTIQAVINKISEHVTIFLRSELHSTNQVMTFAMEQTNATDTWDGTNAETLVTFLQTEIVALATVDSINLASATATAKTSLDL